MEDLSNVDLASALLTVLHSDTLDIFWSDDDLEVLDEVACRLNDMEE